MKRLKDTDLSGWRKRLLFLLLLVPAFSFAQLCADEDTVRSNAASLITAYTARINGSVTHYSSPGNILSTQLRYVRVGQTDTATASASGTNPLRNLSGLQAATQYVYYYTSVCGSGTNRQLGTYTFTTLSASVVYATERSTVFPYIKSDTGWVVPRQDTALFRQSSTTGGNIVFNPTDSVFYGYNKSRWVPLMNSTAGISNKVDSVTVSGDSLFYWINGTAYGYILPANSNDWQLDGNSGTTAGTNFIGTTDDVNLMFKVNNIQSGLINKNSRNTSFGYQSLLANTTGTDNIAIGGNALIANEDGIENIGIGVYSLSSNESGGGNVAMGFTSLSANIVGSNNTAIGTNTLSASTGSANTAVGSTSLAGTTGSSNTGIGSSSLGSLTSGSSNIAIGSNASGYLTNESFRLAINSINRTNLLGDTTQSIIYGAQDATAANQRLYLNSQTFLPYTTAAANAADSMMVILPSTGKVGYRAIPTSSGGTVTGSGTANRGAYWSGTSAITSNANWLFDGTTHTFAANGAASTSSLLITGNPSTAGTTTTDVPLIYANGGTAPTTWSTAGTYLGVNAVSGYTGNFLDFHVNGGASVFSVASTGAIVSASGITGTGLTSGGSIQAGTSGGIYWGGSTYLTAPSDGSLMIRSSSLGSGTLVGGTSTTSTLTYKTTTGVGTTGADHIFQVGNNGATEAMRILNSGNVGIGNSAPASLLTVGNTSTANVISNIYSSSRSDFRLYSTGSTTGYGGFYMLGGDYGSNYMQFGLNDGISTTGQGGATYYDTRGITAPIRFAVKPAGTTSMTIAGGISDNGNWGIGTTSPTAALHIATNGAASVPAGRYDGTWFTGGTATTTKPQLLIEPTGTTSNNWSTNGTGLGINAASGFTGNLIDAQINGVSRFKFDHNTRLTLNGISYGQILNSTGVFYLDQAATENTVFRYNSGSNTTMTLQGTTGNVGIGTTTISARLHTISTTEQQRTGYDASNYYSTTVGSTGGVTFNAVGAGSAFTFSDATTVTGTLSATTLSTTAVAFASLPTGVTGMVATVNNSTTNTWGATIAGGGANTVLAFFNGTNWTVIGQ